MENWKAIRQDVLVNGLSQRAACAKYKLGWHTPMKPTAASSRLALKVSMGNIYGATPHWVSRDIKTSTQAWRIKRLGTTKSRKTVKAGDCWTTFNTRDARVFWGENGSG